MKRIRPERTRKRTRKKKACQALPGSAERVESYARRARQGQGIFQEGDQQDSDERGLAVEDHGNGKPVVTGTLFIKIPSLLEGRPATEMTLGARIRSLRHLAGLTLRDLAEQVKVSHHSLSLIERNIHIPRLDTALALATALGTPLGVLLGEPPVAS